MTMTCERVRELASGFVLGALEPDEMIAVQGHLDGCDRPHPEIDELGGVVPYLAQALAPIEPPDWLRESVIAAARADSPVRRRLGKVTEHHITELAPAVEPALAAEPASAANVVASSAAATPANMVSLRGRIWVRRARIATWTSRVAAAVLVVALAGYAFVVQNERSKQFLPAPQPSDQVTALAPAASGSNAAGWAVLQQTGHIFLSLNNLPATTGDQAYVVWAVANGSVTKVGSFTVDASGWAQLEYDNVSSSSSLWLAIRLEANGQVATPTGPVILSGLLSS